MRRTKALLAVVAAVAMMMVMATPAMAKLDTGLATSSSPTG